MTLSSTFNVAIYPIAGNNEVSVKCFVINYKRGIATVKCLFRGNEQLLQVTVTNL